MGQFITVAKLSEISPKKGRLCKVGGEDLSIYKVGESLHAIGNACPHRGAPLSEGLLDDCVVVCPWHGFRFDVRTGQNPDGMPYQVKSYKLRVEGEDIQVEI